MHIPCTRNRMGPVFRDLRMFGSVRQVHHRGKSRLPHRLQWWSLCSRPVLVFRTETVSGSIVIALRRHLRHSEWGGRHERNWNGTGFRDVVLVTAYAYSTGHDVCVGTRQWSSTSLQAFWGGRCGDHERAGQEGKGGEVEMHYCLGFVERRGLVDCLEASSLLIPARILAILKGMRN